MNLGINLPMISLLALGAGNGGRVRRGMTFHPWLVLGLL